MANSRSGESVIARTVRIIDAFGMRRTSLSAAALARLTGLAPTTAYRLARELVEEGLLERDERGLFRLGRRLWELGSRGSATASLADVALPFMRDVHEVVREHTTLGVLDHDEVLYIARLSSRSETRDITRTAGRLPVHACSSGLVLLAHAPLDYQDEILSRSLPRFTDQTPTDPRGLRRLLAEIRAVGYASVPGIIVGESTGIAVPVMGANSTVVAALNVIVHRGEENLVSTVPALRTAALAIGRALREHRAS